MNEETERERYERQLILITKELAHRERNSLAIVSSVFRQISRHATTIEDFRIAFDSWLESYKKTHDLLSLDQNRVSLIERVRIEFAPYMVEDNITIEGDDILLERHAALNFGLCLHETVTNSIKHGSLSVDTGKVFFSSKIDDKNINLTWIETGGPVPKKEFTYGFGSKLLKYALVEGLKGTYDYRFPETGFIGKVTIPLNIARMK